MILIQVITMVDIPTPDVRYFVRQIADEDGTTFAMAMRGYEAMVKLVKRVGLLEGDDKRLFNEQGFAGKVLDARKTFGYSLLRTVKTIEAEGGDELRGGPQAKRYCKKPGCRLRTDQSSYRFCRRHLPAMGDTDDGDGVYCLPPPRCLGKAVNAGVAKIKGRVLRSKVHGKVFIPDPVDTQPVPEVQEEIDV